MIHEPVITCGSVAKISKTSEPAIWPARVETRQVMKKPMSSLVLLAESNSLLAVA